MDLAGKRLGKFSLQSRRAFVSCALAPCIVAVANFYLGWGLFGISERWLIAVSFIGLFLVMRYLGPTVQELRDYRDKKRRAASPGS
jgi:hypothetical protein